MWNPLRPLGLPATGAIELGKLVVRTFRRDPQPEQRERPQQQPAPPRTPARHPADANAAQFDNVRPLNAQETELFNAIRSYPNNKANVTQARQIAIEVNNASRAFGVDTKVLLAIIAHESQGFDPHAESETGADGLGQLTGVAIQEMRRLSYDPTYDASYDSGERQHYPDQGIRNLVEQPRMQAIFQRLARNEASRDNIHDNIWGSAFYTRISIDRADENRSGNAIVLGTEGVTGTYNGADTAERRAHSAGVANAYREMFNQEIPATLRPKF